MKDKYPLVSIVIPTYKRPGTLARAIKSVLSQTYKNIEILVVDDNNPNTEDRRLTHCVMDEFVDEFRIKYLEHPYNKNGSAARNTGANNANGEYVAFLDDDDEFLPEKIKSQVERMEMLDDTYGCCYSKYICKRNGELVSEGTENREGRLLLDALMRNLNIAAGSNLLIRKDVFVEIGGFDESFKRNQDLEILVKILRIRKIAYTDVLGLIVNAHEQSHSIDFDLVTEQYIKAFSGFINELNYSDKNKLFRMMNLQRFRFKLRLQHDIIGCLKMIFGGELKPKDVLRYTCFLIKGVVTKKTNRFEL